MATASITIRMDAGLKEKVEDLFNDMGMNMTTAFTIFAKTVARQGKMPFEVTADSFYSEAHQERLRKAMADLEAGKGTVHELIEVDDDE
ncbi:MAG: type II toxin-antitoxin system RelB/DinJ family antitoxin [Treponema sp.]|jgi:DNA-damage-inducible protein J|nr:type II toxin-antitoxin system RelB/DinJ family antitoxin [Treponema sp.]